MYLKLYLSNIYIYIYIYIYICIQHSTEQHIHRDQVTIKSPDCGEYKTTLLCNRTLTVCQCGFRAGSRTIDTVTLTTATVNGTLYEGDTALDFGIASSVAVSSLTPLRVKITFADGGGKDVTLERCYAMVVTPVRGCLHDIVALYGNQMTLEQDDGEHCAEATPEECLARNSVSITIGHCSKTFSHLSCIGSTFYTSCGMCNVTVVGMFGNITVVS